ncbi:hypothetical protein D3C77_656860 [compost metagenome]
MTSQLARCASSTGSRRLAHSKPAQASIRPATNATLKLSATLYQRCADTEALAYLRRRLTQNSTSPVPIIAVLTNAHTKYSQRIG